MFKWLMFLVAAIFLPWLAHASVSMMDSVTSDFGIRDIGLLIRQFSYGWEKSPLLIGMAVVGLIVAIANRGTGRR